MSFGRWCPAGGTASPRAIGESPSAKAEGARSTSRLGLQAASPSSSSCYYCLLSQGVPTSRRAGEHRAAPACLCLGRHGCRESGAGGAVVAVYVVYCPRREPLPPIGALFMSRLPRPIVAPYCLCMVRGATGVRGRWSLFSDRPARPFRHSEARRFRISGVAAPSMMLQPPRFLFF